MSKQIAKRIEARWIAEERRLRARSTKQPDGLSWALAMMRADTLAACRTALQHAFGLRPDFDAAAKHQKRQPPRET